MAYCGIPGGGFREIVEDGRPPRRFVEGRFVDSSEIRGDFRDVQVTETSYSQPYAGAIEVSEVAYDRAYGPPRGAFPGPCRGMNVVEPYGQHVQAFREVQPPPLRMLPTGCRGVSVVEGPDAITVMEQPEVHGGFVRQPQARMLSSACPAPITVVEQPEIRPVFQEVFQEAPCAPLMRTEFVRQEFVRGVAMPQCGAPVRTEVVCRAPVRSEVVCAPPVQTEILCAPPVQRVVREAPVTEVCYEQPYYTTVARSATPITCVEATPVCVEASPVVVRRESPIRAPVTCVETGPEVVNSDWVVVEKAPRTVVRHKVVDIGPDGRYIIGEPSGAVAETDVYVSDYAEGIIRLPDGRIKYADGTIQPAAVSRAGIQGSIVALSDGSVLLPDGTIEYPDGTVRKPANITYSGIEGYLGQSNARSLSEEVAELREALKKEGEKVREIEGVLFDDGAEGSSGGGLKQRLDNLVREKRDAERELLILREAGPAGWEAALARIREELHGLPHESTDLRESLVSKEEYLRSLQDQFLQEARLNAEARGLLQAMQSERAREDEMRNLIISEAVLRKEQEMVHEKDRIVAQLAERNAAERQALLNEERANAERLVEQELAAERERLQQQMQELQDVAEMEKKRAEEEQLLAAVERERAMAAEEQLAQWRLQPAPKKKKKRKGKKRAKGKGKAKAKAKGRAVGVISGARKTRVVSKSPARHMG